MNAEYVKGIPQWGSATPFINENGQKFNLSHDDDFSPDELITDGQGNALEVPLLRGKQCFGRPERRVRGLLEKAAWRESDGNVRYGKTHCDRCELKSPGVFAACGNLSWERIESSPDILQNLDRWEVFTEPRKETPERCFDHGRERLLYSRFLRAIERHGGWTDGIGDRARAARLMRQKELDRNKAAKKKAARTARKSTAKAVTPAFCQSLDAEGDRRLGILRQVRVMKGKLAPRWVTKLTLEGCERTVDVWKAKAYLERAEKVPTGKAIAEWMIQSGKGQGYELGTLTTTALSDLKRIKLLESHAAGEPVWSRFTP